MLLELLLIVVFAAHLLATNVASAGPFVCLWLQWRESRSGDPFYGRVGRRLAWHSMGALVVATLLGAIALGLVWHTRGDAFFSAASQIPTSRYWFGGAEWLFYLACLWGYQRLWPPQPAPVRSRRFWLLGLLAFMAGTDLVYHFPPLFSVISMLGVRPMLDDAPPRFSSLMLQPQVVAFVLHYALASAAVAGVYLMAKSQGRFGWCDSDDQTRRLATWGARLALVPTLAQLLSGVYLLIETPPEVRDRLLGGHWLATLAFALAMVAMVGLLHRLATVSLGDISVSETRVAVLLMATIVLLMTAAHHTSRHGVYERQPTAYVMSEHGGNDSR